MQGLLGIVAILAIAFLLSSRKRAINLRIVASAFALQVIIAAFVLKTDIGAQVFGGMSAGVRGLLSASSDGIGFMFGSLADTSNFGVIFAVGVLPIIIFFASLMAILYHFGIMQVVVAGLGKALRFLLGTQPVESLNAAANVFVGQTEAPLALKPYLPMLTKPQLFAVMVSGLASVAGTVLIAYAGMGADIKFLLAASFMSAPGGLLMAKIMMPDDPDEVVEEQKIDIATGRKEHTNFIMAAAVGAQEGLKLAVNIAAMLIAFISLIALTNLVLGGIGGWFGMENLSIQWLLGWAFSPIAWLIGVPWSEANLAGSLLGEKIILNEFVAYASLTAPDMLASLSPQTIAIMTFALCGFANLSSIGILLGGLGQLIPEKMPLIAKYGVKAVIAGTLSNLMSATLAGLMLGL